MIGQNNNKCRAVAFLLLLAFLFSGCLKSVRPDRRAVVQALGFDRTAQGYQMTLQIYQSGMEQGKELKVVDSSGSSLTKILADLSVKEGKEIFLGSLQLVVLGEQAAAERAGECLNFLNNFHQIPPNLPVAVAQGEAGAILKMGEQDPSASVKMLTEMLENARSSGQAPSGTLMETLACMSNQRVSACLPLLAVAGEESVERPAQEGSPDNPLLDELLGELTEQEPSSAPEQKRQEKGISLAGIAVFQGERLQLQLDSSVSRGLGLLEKETQAMVMPINTRQNGQVSIITRVSKVEIIPEVMGDSIVFNILIKARGGVSDREADAEENEDVIAGLMESAIRVQVEKMLSVTLGQGLDPLGLSRMVQQKEPKFYKAHSDNWFETLRTAGYSVRVECTLEQNGTARKETSSVGM